jgi:hypothetical protein
VADIGRWTSGAYGFADGAGISQQPFLSNERTVRSCKNHKLVL